MSSFICSAKHFNSIESKLFSMIYDRDFYPPYSLKNAFPGFYNRNEPDAKLEMTDVVNTLRSLNVLCVSLQYAHHYRGRLDDEINTQMQGVKQRTPIKHISLHGLYNSLRCLRYQIEPEHLQDLRPFSPDEEKAMLFLDEMIDALAHTIVSKMPEDKTCTWSID